MPFAKGKSGNPGGRPKSKLFREALLAELAAAGDNTAELRDIARKLIEMAKEGDIQAVKEVADRLEGKPAQESTVTIDDKRNATDWTRDELVAFLNECRAGHNGASAEDGRDREPDSVH